MARSNINEKDRGRIVTRAQAIVNRKRDSGQPFFKEVTAWANDRLAGEYTVAQISAMLGRRGFAQTPNGRGTYNSRNSW